MKRYLGTYSLIVLLPVALTAGLLIGFMNNGSGSTTSGDSDHTTLRLLVAVSVVVAAAALAGAVARRCGQPRVVGELAAGIVLGPSVFGALAPGAWGWLLPPSLLPRLDTLSQFGVIFFMFLVGAELPWRALRHSAPVGFVIGHASIAMPFLAGTGMAFWLHDHYPSERTSLTVYVLFIALAFSITAFPVLARILSERKLLHTPLGVTGMTAAGIGDVTAWGLLAVVISAARGTSLIAAALSMVYVAVFAVIMFWVIRPLVARAVARVEQGGLSRDGLFVSLVCLVLTASLATELMGVHAIFGAFTAGVIMPRESQLIAELTNRIEGVTVWFLLPLFFTVVGLRTELGTLSGAGAWLTCLLITVVAVVAKVTSATAAASATGHTKRESLALGMMMNCRGLTELIVLNVGVQLGVLSTELFAMFVVMALVTTAMTGPLLHYVLPAAATLSPDDATLSRRKEESHHDVKSSRG